MMQKSVRGERRFFLAKTPEAAALIATQTAARREALDHVSKHVETLIAGLAAELKRSFDELGATTTFGLDGATLDGAAMFGRLNAIGLRGKFKRDVLKGWSNAETRRADAPTLLKPKPDNKDVAALPRVPGAPDFARALHWPFYVNANVAVGAPRFFESGDQRGFSVGSRALFHPDPKLERRLRAWKAPAGFEEITQARMRLLDAQAAVAREEATKQAA